MTSEYLYNLHSKGLDDFSDSASEEIASEDENKPPLYTYEELRPNLVVFDGRGTKNYESDMSDQSSDEKESAAQSPPVPEHIMKLAQVSAEIYCKHEKTQDFEAVENDLDKELSKFQLTTKTAEQIQRELKKQFTQRFCNVCNKQNISEEFFCHYNSGNHIANVHKWLKDRNLKKPVDVKYLFCGACNLPLAGNDKAKKHYTTPEHLKKSKTFCAVCLRSIKNVSAHLSTKGHLKKLEKAQSNIEVKRNNESCVTYAGALKMQDCDDAQGPVTTETAKNDEDNFVKLSDYLNQLKRAERKVATPESISVKFAKLMANKICQFCPDSDKKVNRKHLKQFHFDNVAKWLESQIAELENPIELALLFCDVCNLPLSGTSSALEHYDTIVHSDTVKTFCKVCWQRFPNLQLHNQSNKHLKKLKVVAVDISSDSNTTMQSEDTTKSYATAVKGQSESDTSDSFSKKEPAIKAPKPMKQYQRLATYVLRFLNRSYCYVCNVPVAKPEHYESQLHMRTLQKWLEEIRNLLELFGIRDVEELVCIGCKIVFHDSKVAESHYLSEEHERTLQTFCKKCLVHENAPVHKEHNRELEADDSEKSKEPFVSSNNINSNPSVLLATNLRIMLTPSLCEVCNEEIRRNVFHYAGRNHILMVRNWLSYGMQSLQIGADPRLIFCEACSLVLNGSTAAREHYKQPGHLVNQPLYCPHCVFKGTSDTILQHAMSLEHKISFDNSVNLQNLLGIGQQPQNRCGNPYVGQNLLVYQPITRAPVAVPSAAVASFMESVSRRAFLANLEENRVRVQLDCEVKRLLDLLYCSGKAPPKEAVNYLSVVNQKLDDRMHT